MTEDAAQRKRELEKTHTVRPLPFFIPQAPPMRAGPSDEKPAGSSDWKLLSPRSYEAEIPGSLVAITVSVEHIHNRESGTFSLRPDLMHVRKLVALGIKLHQEKC